MLMGDLLEEFFKRPYVAAKVAEGKLPDTWRAIVGEAAAAQTTSLRLERGVLYVGGGTRPLGGRPLTRGRETGRVHVRYSRRDAPYAKKVRCSRWSTGLSVC